MRKILLALLVVSLGVSHNLKAQYNKAYFFYVGHNYIVDSKYRDAIETLNMLLRVDPEAYEGYLLRGIAKYNLDDLLGAEVDFTKAIQLNPVFTMAYQYRAITRSKIGNYEDALKDYAEAIHMRPDLPAPLFSRGVTYLLTQQPQKALEDFSNYIRSDDKSVDAYLNRGTCHLMLKDTLRAMSDFERAIQINRDRPDGYGRRGVVYLERKETDLAIADFNQAIGVDSTYLPAFFYRATLYASTLRPVEAINDFTQVLKIDSTNALTYYNRAILSTQIGDYNRALEDYNRLERYAPENVLLYYNRAGLQTQLGDLKAAVDDYSRAIALYPDFANAYLARSQLRYLMMDDAGSRSDRRIAEHKIAEYRSKLRDSTFSIYADTSRRFNQLLSFDLVIQDARSNRQLTSSEIRLLPMFKFTLLRPDSLPLTQIMPKRYYVPREEEFLIHVAESYVKLSHRETDLSPEEMINLDRAFEDSTRYGQGSWQAYFKLALTQSLLRQYTNSINCYTQAIDLDPLNPFLFMNRSATQSEMIDFISSIDNHYQHINIDNDPGSQLKNNTSRVYNYDDAIADLSRAAQLLPEYAYIYYNRANLRCRSGMISQALEDYTRAIELNPDFGEAYYNRGLVQIFLKDTRKGCLDVSKAGELGVAQAYGILKRYGEFDAP